MLAKYNIKSVAITHRKIANYLPQVKDAIGLKHREYTRSHANVVRSILDRVVDPSICVLKNMIDTSDWSNQTNLLWLNTASTRTTSSDYKTPNFSLQKQDTVTGSSERPLK
jgi:hypothetical protein